MGMMQTGAIVVGPAIAGLLLAFSTPGLALGMNGFSFLIFGIIFLFLLPRIVIKAEENKEQKSSMLKIIGMDWKIVFQFAKKNLYFIVIYCLVQLTFVVGSSLDSQEVVFAKQVLNLDSSGYSLLVTVCGVGYLLGACFVAIFAQRLPIRLLIAMTFMTGIGFLIYAYSKSFWVAALGFIVLGFFQSCGSTGFQTFFQKHVPVEKMGRISSVFGLFQGGLIVVLTVLAGVISDAIGVKGMVVGGAFLQLAVCVLLVIIIALPRRAHDFEDETSDVVMKKFS